MTNEAKHSLKLVVERGGEVRFITAIEDGHPCWFYMRMDPLKYHEYEKALNKSELNIRDYGTILQSGWGYYPPGDVATYMFDKHNVPLPEED